MMRLGISSLVSGRKAALAVVTAAVVLAILIRIPFFFWPLTADEGIYAYTAHWWLRGLTLYSEDLWLDRPQGIFLAYQLGLKLLGGATWSIRLWGALWAAGTTVAVYLVAKRLSNQRAGIAAAFLLALFSAAPHIHGFTANAETFMVLPLTLSAYFLLDRKLLAAGFLASIAVLLKPPAASGFMLAVLWLAYQRAGWRQWWRFVAGALPPGILALGHGVVTVGLARYVNSVALLRLGLWSTVVTQPGLRALSGWFNTSSVWAPLAIIGIPGLQRIQRRALVFTLLWVFSSVVGVAIGGHWFQHYFIQLVPPLAVWGGAGLSNLWASKKLWLRLEGVAIPVVFFLLFEGQFFLQQTEKGSWPLHGQTGYLVSEEVAAYIETHTGSDDTIYVAFAQANIYYLSKRRSALPYMFPVHIVHIPGAYEQAVDVVKARKPTYVLAFDAPLKQLDPENRFWQALEAGYEIEATFQGVPLYRRKSELQ